MRCSPLALLEDDECIEMDASITNPHPVCIDCNKVYVNCLRMLIKNKNISDIFKNLLEIAKTENVKSVIESVLLDEERDISDKKGWCLHGLWVALKILKMDLSYNSSMEWIIKGFPGSDTDTNACIAGAVWGAKNGFKKMLLEKQTSENIEILLNVNVDDGPCPRPEKYTLSHFDELIEKINQNFD